MSSSESSKSFHGLGQALSSGRHKVSGLRPEIPASPFGEKVVKDTRSKRVLKACERCKIKKIKCDARGPCKRCKEDGMICVTSSKRKPKFESVPRAYAEVLENTNFALTATVEKLYIMLRNGETWELDEPELNGHGMPIIHDVARVLGCIRGPPDDVWLWPGRSSHLYETEPNIYLAHPELGKDKQMALSEAHHFSSESGGLSSSSQNSETSFSPIETATPYPLIQQDWSLSWKHSMPRHQESQQMPDIILSDVLMQDTQDHESTSPFFPMDPLDSPPYQLPKPETDMFIAKETTNSLLLGILPEEIDWTIWSDLLPLENNYTVTEAVGRHYATTF